MGKLTKEECLQALENLKCRQTVDRIDGKLHYCYMMIDNYAETTACFKQLINEHFELKEQVKKGTLSDGYHTFNELYDHRAVLFSIICNQNKDLAWKSKKHDDGTMFDGYFIVGIKTPLGQYTYHYPIDAYWDMFDVKELENAPKWDRHQPKDIDRLFSIITDSNPPLKFEELHEGMWVWDNGCKAYLKIRKVFRKKNIIWFYTEDVSILGLDYKENRFYRHEVKENEE